MKTPWTILLGGVLASLLSGCAGMRLIEAQVQTSHTANTIEAGARYRFERLPSQAEDSARSTQVEAMAEAALAQAGLNRDDAQARYSVLLGVRTQSYVADAWGRPLSPYSGPFASGGIMIGGGSGGSVFGWGMRFPPSTQHRHEVSLLLRDLQNGQVVYETRAAHDGPWSDAGNILRALFDAALQDFPHAPAGPRAVRIEIPR